MVDCSEVIKNIDKNDCVELVNAILSSNKIFFVAVGRVFLSLKFVAKRYLI